RHLHSFPTRRSSDLLIVALVVAIIAIIWLTVKSSPSKTPLAMTAALVGAIIKGAKLLPQPGGDFYWYSIFGLLAVGGLVVLIARSEEHTSELQSRRD